MMNSYRRNNSAGRRLLYATILVIFIFLVDVVSGGKIHQALRSTAASISRSVSGIGSSIAGSGFFTSRASLEAENRSLREELAQYQERAAGFAVLEAQVAQLQSAAKLAAQNPGLTAPVVSSVISSPYGTFLIGAGSADGVAKGSLVLTGGGFVVGTVSDAGAHTSTVTEIFAPNTSVAAVIDGASTVVSGSGGGNAHALLPRGVGVAVGDAVLSPQFGQRAVGIVGSVASSSASASQDVYIRIPEGLASLQYVYVVSH